MDIFAIIEKFGIPVAVSMAFGFFIWKQNKFIQDTLMDELEESFKRVEGIIIQLINQQKLMQIEQKGIEKSFKSIVFNDELQKEVVKALNDSVDIPFLSEKTEEKIMNAVYDTVEGVIKAALKKAL